MLTVSDELSRLRRCFQPRQWFQCEEEPHPFALNDEESFMWVYRVDSEGKFEVGYYAPDKQWFAESVYDTREDASARVNYLMGGK